MSEAIWKWRKAARVKSWIGRSATHTCVAFTRPDGVFVRMFAKQNGAEAEVLFGPYSSIQDAKTFMETNPRIVITSRPAARPGMSIGPVDIVEF